MLHSQGMFNIRGSLLSRLQWGFALGAFLLAGCLAVFMDATLHRGLDAEDALVMEAMAQDLLGPAPQSQAAPGKGTTRLERVEWKLTGARSAQSAAFPVLDAARIPVGAFAEIEAGGRAFLVSRRTHPGGELWMVMDRTHEEVLVGGFRRTLLLAVAFSAVMAAVMGRFVAARGLRPLHDLAEEAAAIRPASLGHRLDPSHYPMELEEVVQRLNGARSEERRVGKECRL